MKKSSVFFRHPSWSPSIKLKAVKQHLYLALIKSSNTFTFAESVIETLKMVVSCSSVFIVNFELIVHSSS